MKKALLVALFLLGCLYIDYLAHYNPTKEPHVQNKSLEMSYVEYKYDIKRDDSKPLFYTKYTLGSSESAGGKKGN